MYDLIYDRKCLEALKSKFPDIKTNNLSSWNYKERFLVEIDDSLEEKYYKFLIKTRLSRFSSVLIIKTRTEEGRKALENLVKEINRERLII